MSETTTKLANLINPEVMGDGVTKKLVDGMKLIPYIEVDDTLKDRAGNTITVPKFAYIGDAEDVAEGVAIGTVKLTATSSTQTVKKAGKGVDITDESVLSGYGDPIGEAESQLATSIKSKIEKDAWTACSTAPLKVDTYKTKEINVADVIRAKAKAFGEEVNEPMTLLVDAGQYAELVIGGKDELFERVGITIEVANRLNATQSTFKNILVRKGALSLLLKRAVELETERDIEAKTTLIVIDEHYSVYIKDDSKVAIIEFNNPAVS